MKQFLINHRPNVSLLLLLLFLFVPPIGYMSYSIGKADAEFAYDVKAIIEPVVTKLLSRGTETTHSPLKDAILGRHDVPQSVLRGTGYGSDISKLPEYVPPSPCVPRSKTDCENGINI